MDGLLIFAARLPISPSVNNANKRNRRGGVYKDESVVNFRETVANMIHFHGKTLEAMPFAPYYIKHISWPDIKNNIQAYKRRDKIALAMRTKWRIVIQVFVKEDRRDADNFIKELIDAIFKAIGMNDKCISSISLDLVVDKDCNEHMAVIIRETDKTWGDGDLLRYVDLELHLGKQYNENGRVLDSERGLYSL